MSSPNHLTSNIEDAFSFNFPNYTTASPGNISPDPSDNLSKYLFASLSISPFHDMKAYNVVANKPPISLQYPITPSTILTPSLVLPPSVLFDLRYFFVPEELLPPNKQIHTPSSSLTVLSNSSRKQACILMPPKRTSTSKASAMTHAAIRKLVVDSVATALEAQAATMASPNNPNRNFGPRKTPVARKSNRAGNETQFCTKKPITINESLRIEGTPPTATTTTTITTTVAMIITNSRIGSKKPSGLILPPMGILRIVPRMKDATYITQDLALSSVKLATR
nr:hypothetical protein [Tanacetum cinerariifolium]